MTISKTMSAALFFACSAAAAGCGGHANASTEIKVGLYEYVVAPDHATAPAGPIHFVANNSGGEMHELVLLKTDLAENALPMKDGDVDEEGTGVENVGEASDIAAGASGEFTVTAAAGKYILMCNMSMDDGTGTIIHHYAKGMHVPFTVQ